MGLEAPRLDDRSFNDLMEEVRARIPLYTPEWTDHNLSDPGITMLELFAYMTDVVLYRLNRVPDKHYIKFMELIGMELHEAVPAQVDVTFWLSSPQPGPMVIPADCEVATTRTDNEEAIVFTTDRELTVKIPELTYLLTSFQDDDTRQFNNHNVSGALAGIESITAFASEPPTTDDAIYFGFEENLSNHILGFELEVDRAEGAGIDPRNPPYVWEVLDLEMDNQWNPVRMDHDDTLGLNTSGLIRVIVPELARATRNGVAAYWVRLRLDFTDTDSRYNVSPRINRVTVTSWGGTVNATNATRLQKEVVGRSDGTPGQIFYLEHTPVVARSAGEYILIRLEDGRDQRWQEVSDFSLSTATDRHYTLDSNNGELRFGPALPQPDGQVRRFGAIPPKGAMIVMQSYRYGGGVVGNVAARTVNVSRTAVPYIDHVMNLTPASGGLDSERLDNARLRVPGHLRSLQRAVTAADFEYLADLAAPGRVGRVHCLQPPLTNRGENKLLIIPHIPVARGFISPESLELTTEVRDQIHQYLDERRLLSTRLDVTIPAYQWVETEVDLRVTQHHDPDAVRQRVEARLFEFINPITGGVEGNGWRFGRDLLVSDVMAAISGVEGVQFIRSVKLYPIAYDNRQWQRGNETTSIAVASDGLVVSYQHRITMD
jgi:predicted phage baseplate assembly protein